ncbi:YgaP family membrane protein [Algoriphagus antarcticus]|uniref:Inner membrane protein YgaP-like transmembrane domain-containing protein n=1 Tax=Algoriphagus antarcticus TaxID=238540 RepID=A0A3E0DU51_9BACT|nr:DUF2892 domain-containing protein [Algoriphagus antarcticus]REG87062.1 hypothetical protein C8N25_11141 [Algoriphagus antarcticus]
MKKNMGSADKIIRLLLAVGVAVLYFTGTISGTLAIVLGVLAVVFVATSFMSFCPLYLPFGISTCKKASS